MSFRSSPRDIPVVAAGRGISVVGDEMALIALLLWASSAGHGPLLVAALVTAAALPQLVLSPITGLASDRLPLRRLVVGTSLVQASFCLALAAALPTGSEALVISLVLLRACGQAFLGPAWQTWVPSLVPADGLTRALSTVQASTAGAALVGPLLGGALVAGAGSAWALVVDAATFLAVGAAALLVSRTPDRVPPATREGRRTGELTAGLSVAGSDPVVRGFLAVVATVVIALGALNVAEVFLITRTLGAGPTAYGAVATMFALGLVVGSWLARRVRGDSKAARTLVGGTLLMSVAAIALGLSPTVAVAALASALIGLGNGLMNVLGQTLCVRRTPREVLGRVLAVLQAVVGAGALIATALGGALLALVDVRVVVVASGIATGVVLLVVSRSLLRAAAQPVAVAGPAATEPEPARAG